MKVHFTAIGGSAMHNLAIALHKKGYKVTGSDDEIFEPARSRLKKYGLLPDKEGWDVSKINEDLDAVILGMHAKIDNPELIKAKKLGIKIFSYPEYLYEQSKNKLRVVIGGSHGKTTITAMIMHVLNYHKIDFDFMVGAQLKGFEVMVRLSDKAPFMIIEGDEYLTSPIDRRPKFHLYKPNIALINGISWDHINVFPTYENYTEQFRIFANLVPDGGTLIYYKDDKLVKNICEASKANIKKLSYSIPEYFIERGTTYIIFNNNKIPLKIFGRHNLINLNGARLVCKEIGISDKQFLEAIQSFKGASKRLELVAKNDKTAVFIDFAHSPSKLKATIKAVKEQYPEKQLVSCMELHTFSSLNKIFLPHYKGTMDDADIPIVYFNPHTIKLKNLPSISITQIKEAFANSHLKVYTDSSEMIKYLLKINWENKNLLMMSSGNFNGINIHKLADKIISVCP